MSDFKKEECEKEKNVQSLFKTKMLFYSERADGLERKGGRLKAVSLEREKDRWLFASCAAASHYLVGPQRQVGSASSN